MATNPFAGQSLLLVTGRLAEPALRRMVPDLQQRFDVKISIQVMPITVAALMSPDWISRHLAVPEDCDAIILPGYCAHAKSAHAKKTNRSKNQPTTEPAVEKDNDGLLPLRSVCDCPIHIGPRDMRRLPEFFGGKLQPASLDKYSIQIIAEINHAPRFSIEQILQQATHLKGQGADVIDIGCQPGEIWSEVGTVVKELVQRDFRVSIDSLEPREIEPAVNAGASLVLSVNSTNRQAAVDWGCEVIAIPDSPDQWRQVADTVEFLDSKNVPFRIDPIIEPIGFGFAASLSRYMQARKIWPDAEMMMGIGNLTELTDVDSSGINFLLLAICQELSINSVLTTQVINWASSSVRECDLARRMVYLALQEQIPPKNISDQLVCLRDSRLRTPSVEEIDGLAEQIRDNNYRILADQNTIHLLGSGQHWQDADAFELFHQLMQSKPTNVDASHAFYLGYEMCKATIANQLGKNYEQDEALNWGHLTAEEVSHRRLKRRHPKNEANPNEANPNEANPNEANPNEANLNDADSM